MQTAAAWLCCDTGRRGQLHTGFGGCGWPYAAPGGLRVSSHCCSDFCSQEIERLKSEKPTWERRLRWEGMKSVFGGPPSLLWMNPFVGFRFRRLQMRTRKGGPEFSV